MWGRCRITVLIVACLVATRGQAAEPLELVPQEADFVAVLARPGEIVDSLWSVLQDERLRRLPAYQEALEQVSVRRLLQLVRYAERELGKPWRVLLDELAGEGIVLAGKYGPAPSPVLLMVQGRNPALMQRAASLFFEVLEEELARRELPHQRQEHERSGLKVVQMGEAYYAVHGAALLVSNRLEVFDYVAPLAKGKLERSLAQSEKWQTARKTIPQSALAWAWFDMRPLQQLKQVQEVLALPGDLAIVHVLLGRYLDIFKRSTYLTAYVTAASDGPSLTVYAPAGWKGASVSACTQIPQNGRATLCLPLAVPGTIYSSSFYFQPAEFLRRREQLLTEQQRQAFENFDKNTAKFLLGTRFSELVMGMGSRHRLVVAQPDRKTYGERTQSRVPSFAIIVELKDQRLGPKVSAILRGAAFLASFQNRLELVEEEQEGVKLVGYRFVDNEANRSVQNGLLFNFSPCFAQLGDQFMLCSTLELGRKLVTALLQEQRQPSRAGDEILFQDLFFWDGIGELLQTNKEQLVVQFMLERVQSKESAQQQAETVIELLRSLGCVELRLAAEAETSRLELHVKRAR